MKCSCFKLEHAKGEWPQVFPSVVAVWVPGMLICDLKLKSHCQGLPQSHDHGCCYESCHTCLRTTLEPCPSVEKKFRTQTEQTWKNLIWFLIMLRRRPLWQGAELSWLVNSDWFPLCSQWLSSAPEEKVRWKHFNCQPVQGRMSLLAEMHSCLMCTFITKACVKSSW